MSPGAISGLFRDMFPTQIALMDADGRRGRRTRTRTGRKTRLPLPLREGDTSPPASSARGPATYGAGIEDQLASGRWDEREELGRAYLAATSHSYGGVNGNSREAQGAFAARGRRCRSSRPHGR